MSYAIALNLPYFDKSVCVCECKTNRKMKKGRWWRWRMGEEKEKKATDFFDGFKPQQRQQQNVANMWDHQTFACYNKRRFKK